MKMLTEAQLMELLKRAYARGWGLGWNNASGANAEKIDLYAELAHLIHAAGIKTK